MTGRNRQSVGILTVVGMLALALLLAFFSGPQPSLAYWSGLAGRVERAGGPAHGQRHCWAAARAVSRTGDDTAPSLGTFDIFIEPDFRPLMAGYPGYNATTFVLTSPTMYDPTTIIGRSAPHLHGSPPDVNGTPVGTAGVVIADSDFVVEPAGFQGPDGTREVHTRIADFNLAAFGGLVTVRAGDAAPVRPTSPGEVQSLSGASGDPNLDFPAESFFDVFVEVDLPPLGSFPGGTLFNNEPLLVINDELPDFPPRVVYIHGQTPVVPVLFLQDDPGGAWLAGDLFGWLSLAGHGMNYTNTQPDVDEFYDIMRFVPSLPLACQEFRPEDHDGNAIVDLGDIILIANRWPLNADILGVQHTAAAFGLGCLVDPPPPLQIPAGADVFHSPPGQTMQHLELPLNFFGPGSDPFVGTVNLGGVQETPPSVQPFQPVGPFQHVSENATHTVVDARQTTAQGDTVVQRLGDAELHFPGSPAAAETVPIEIVSMNLQSVEPIVVTYNGGQNPEQWAVQLFVEPTAQQQSGAMTVVRTGPNQGVFTMDLPVNSQLVFNRVDGPPQQVGPVPHQEHFYTGFGTNSPLGPAFDTGAPVPWTLP
ncbi:MAG: hypothetical protein R2844_21115 [Caldilineales bacterium]